LKIALIPPIPDLDRCPRTGFHLILAHLLHEEEYTRFYQVRRKAGDYLILDNGAHELGVSLKEGELLTLCRQLRAQELVLPDVLFDRRGTVERTKRMLKYIVNPNGWRHFLSAGAPRFMLVPQGTDRADWAMCLKHLLEVWDEYSAKTPVKLANPVIGISKDYDDWKGGLAYLIGHYVEPLLRIDGRQFDVHCLGWPNNLWAIAKVKRNQPYVRSTDSAKPFVYAKNGITLEPGGPIPKYPRRDANYFKEPLSPLQWKIAERNMLVYQAAATDDLVLSV
jgi:hypothetical protein